MKLLDKDVKSFVKNWKLSKALKMSTTFAGVIQFSGTTSEAKTKLSRVNARLSKQELESEVLPTESTPTDEDFVEVTYRALSAAMLADRPIDFSNAPMLKRSVRLLNGQTVFKDHETSVDNWVGRVIDTFWDTETKGFPEGINARLQLDSVKDPMVVRGVLQGAIHSASVTVSFEWKPSHKALMDDGSFFQRLGEEVDGEVVRIVVTKIEKYWEISLVWQGADEFAKQIGEDGKPVHQSVELDEVDEIEDSCEVEHLMNAIDDENPEKLSQSLSSVDKVINQQEELNMKILEQLKKILGKDVTEDTLEVVIKEFSAVTSAEAIAPIQKIADENIAKLSAELTSQSSKIEELNKKVADLSPNAELGAKYLADEREETIRLCKLSKGENVSEAILKTLSSGSLELVQAFKSEFAKEVEAKFPSKCGKCGSKEISRQSSKTEDAAVETRVTQINNPELSQKLRQLHG